MTTLAEQAREVRRQWGYVIGLLIAAACAPLILFLAWLARRPLIVIVAVLGVFVVLVSVVAVAAILGVSRALMGG